MKWPHLFEFMDQAWLPASLRCTLREILECGNAWPFRSYYRSVVEGALQTVKSQQIKHVVELGAGTAPLTRMMAAADGTADVQFIVCDQNPDLGAYRELCEQFPGKVTAITTPVDFSQPRQWPPSTLLILSATLHHIPNRQRADVIKTLAASADQVLVTEPLRRSLASAVFVFGSLVPALLLPIVYVKRPGRLTRLLWCWLVPVAPLIFLWDGLVSCIRQWTEREWTAALAGNLPRIAKTLFCQNVGFGR